MSGRKVYLGDAVYAAVEPGYIVLTTEDGINATNTIYLEPEVVNALQEFMRSLDGARQ